jgi:multiple sugar transport system substrate-binding protein
MKGMTLNWRNLLLTLVAAALLAIGLSSAQADPGAAEVPLNPEVSGDVEFWHFWGSPVRRTAIRRVVAICQEELPNIRVTEVFRPWGDIWTANIAAVAARAGMPDVIVSDRPQLPRDAVEGIYQDLNELAERDGITGERFWPFAWEQSLYEGEVYGVPHETDVRVLFYNRSLLREAGVEEPPTTWEELWEVADALDVQNADGSYERIAFHPLHGNVGPDLWVMTMGHEWVQDGRPVVDDPAVAETLEWIKSWIDRYGGWAELQRFLAQFGAPPNDAFMAGGVVMKVDVAGYHSIMTFYDPRITLADGTSERLEWSASLPPYAQEPATWSGGFAFSVPTGVTDVEAAWEFIKCATSTMGQASWARDTYAIPTDVGAANDPALMADPIWQFFIEAMDHSKLVPFVPEYPNWQEQLNQRYERIWTGELDVQQALQEAQAAIDQTIEENR